MQFSLIITGKLVKNIPPYKVTTPIFMMTELNCREYICLKFSCWAGAMKLLVQLCSDDAFFKLFLTCFIKVLLSICLLEVDS